jgi:carboxylesterase type B
MEPMNPLPHHAANFPSASAATGESTFVCHGILMTESLPFGQQNSVWDYRFDVSITEETALGNGVLHAFDTAAIFGPYYQGSTVEATIQVHPFSTYDASIVPIEMNHYISFVRSLSPNTSRAEQAPIWEPFEGKHGKQRLLLEINDTRTKCPRHNRIDVPFGIPWRRLVESEWPQLPKLSLQLDIHCFH